MLIGSNVIQALAGAFAIAAACVVFFIVPDGSSNAIKWAGLIVFYLIALRALLTPVNIVPGIPTVFSIEVLFLIFYYLIFLAPYQYDVLGLTDLNINKYVSYSYVQHTNKALVTTIIGLVAFTLGIRAVSSRPVLTATEPSRQNVKINYNSLYPALAFLHLSLMAIYHLSGWRSSDEGRYVLGESGGAIANGVYILIIMLSIMLIAAFVNQLRTRARISLVVWIGLVLAIAWSLRVLIYGDRNNFFLIMIALFGGLMTYRIKASLLVLAFGFTAAMVIYNGVETFRMVPDKSLSGLIEGMFAGNRDADLSSGSFSITLTTLKATFAIVPGSEPFAFGWYKLIGFLGVIPLVRGVFLPENLQFLTSADLLSSYMLGPRATWSVGSNILSDIYVDFGIFGVAVLMAALGWVAAQLQNLAAVHNRSPAATMIYLIALPLFAELPRYSLDFPVRMLVWAAIILLAHRVLALLSTRKPSVTSAARYTK